MKRYNYEYYNDASHDSGMEEDEEGKYVEYSEVEALLKDIEQLKRADEILRRHGLERDSFGRCTNCGKKKDHLTECIYGHWLEFEAERRKKLFLTEGEKNGL